MKKLLLLALGFSLAAQNVNANLLTQDQARNARKAAAAVYVGTTALKAATVDLGVDVNERVNDAQKYSKQLYAVLASALEEGDLAVKIANVLKDVNTPALTRNIAAWYNTDKNTSKEEKAAINNTLKQRSKLEALNLSAAVAAELGEVFADKFVNNKLNNKYARRTTRAFTYAVNQALVAASKVTVYNYATAPAADKTKKKSKEDDNTPSKFAIAKDVFVHVLVAAFIENLAYEAAGEAAAELLIEKSVAIEAAA